MAANAKRTLRRIRQDAPRQDRGEPALRQTPAQWKPGQGSRYAPARLYAATLDELRDRMGRYGEAAVQQAVWSCVSTALMKDEIARREGTMAAVQQQRVYMWGLTGLPDSRGGDYPVMPAPDDAATALAHEARAAWEAAGEPRLTDKIKQVQQYITACLTHRNKDTQTEGEAA